jgi:Na+/phosphate symporter
MVEKQHEAHKNFFDKHEWWFVALGLIGNMMFFVGSICFLFKPLETIAIGFFIAGSGLMLVSSSAESIAEHSRNKLKEKKHQQRDHSHGKFKQTEYSS